jgi:hypothetical protein
MSKSVLFASTKNDLAILEWTIHHLTLGFDHIHIFQPAASTVLDSLVEADIRVTIQQETLHEQMRDIAQTLGADWMLYLDSDEFVVLDVRPKVVVFCSFPNKTKLSALKILVLPLPLDPETKVRPDGNSKVFFS